MTPSRHAPDSRPSDARQPEPARPTLIGQCGLGNMGNAIAGRLTCLAPVIGYDPDRSRSTGAAEAHGVRPADDLREVAGAEVVVLSLPTPSVSKAVVTELVDAMRPGALIVETSTVNPADVWHLRDVCRARSIRLIDAAILSGVGPMREGTSALLIGGAHEDVALAGPVLDALAARQVHLGPVGSGMAAKVINNAVAHAVMVVLAEAGAMAMAAGVDTRALADLLGAPDGGLIRPLTHRFMERILASDYEGGMPTDAARKDSTLALQLAQDSGVPLFAIQAAHTVYEIAGRSGVNRDDYASIARLWERWLDQPFATGRPSERLT